MVKSLTYIVIAALLGVIFLSVIADEENRCSPGGAVGDTSVPSGSYALPEAMPPGQITSPFGPRGGTMHKGIDIATGAGAPLYAFADGVVLHSGPASGFGNWIVLEHESEQGKFVTVYGHLFAEDLLVRPGQIVRAGQQISREGYNGEVYPPGPGGAHLHFEIHPGGLGNAVDPEPWLAKAVNASGDIALTQSVDAPKTSLKQGQELPPVPATIGSEAHLQRDTIRVMRAVHAAFPEITTMGGWRPTDAYPDHPSGRAVDIMIPNFQSTPGQELGTRIKDWLYANRAELNIDYMIWQQTYIPATGEANLMPDRGSLNENHFNHVHITTKGGGFPAEDESYTMSSINAGSGSYGLGVGCASGPGGASDLAAGTVPPELEPWLRRAGGLCQGVSSSLLAAQMSQESQFTPNLVSGAGAMGYAQFMPGTWASVGAKVDSDGQVVGPPGSGDPNDPADAAMAQGRFMCQLNQQMSQALASGTVKGDLTELTLAAYNAGPGNVLSYGGVPPFAETTSYVKIITENASRYA
ncbi:MAG: peptidoglycan DD-metalloendopeptidase family protein [Corynebacterium sp.]|nr:peptidoglycan DD-metalloendopeptidase family protein [Corynebacterium sp.]